MQDIALAQVIRLDIQAETIPIADQKKKETIPIRTLDDIYSLRKINSN